MKQRSVNLQRLQIDWLVAPGVNKTAVIQRP
jgi:hypothetical protein